MSAEEDTELRDLIIDTLEKKGVLAKIKAELRASVFLALEETENEKYKIPLSNDAIQRFKETRAGEISLALVRDFLEFFRLDYTLAVFDAEISPFKPVIKRGDIERELNLDSNTDAPLLTHLVRERREKSFSKIQQDNFDTPRTRNVNWKNEINLFQANVKGVNDNTFLVNDATNANTNVDPFFDDPIGEKEPFSFSISGSGSLHNEENVSANRENALQPESINRVEKQIPQNNFMTGRGDLSDQGSEDDILSEILQRRTGKKITGSPKGEPAIQNSGMSLSSLKDLPSLNAKPKVDIRSQWLEQFDNILHAATFSCGQDDYEDDFQSSESGKSCPKYEVKKNGSHSKDTDGSVEEDIEEDISLPADDLLNTSASLGEDNDVTSDRTISHLSGTGGYDYMEKLPS